MKKQLYLITFGVCHPCARFVQPVLAENHLVARGIACRYFGTQRSTCYGPESYVRKPNGDYTVAGSMYYPSANLFDVLDQEQETEIYGEYLK